MPDRIRVAVIDDHPLFRAGVASTLREADDMEVAGEGATAEDAVRIARTCLPDVILLDVGIPGGGIEAARVIGKTCALVKSAMLTVSENERHVADALRCGVNGYILKGSTGAELLQIVRAVQTGELYITPFLATRLVTQATQQKNEASVPFDVGELTYRQEQILELLPQGLKNKEIACRLHITEKTVKNYMTEIMQKLNARNRIEAILIGRRRRGAADY